VGEQEAPASVPTKTQITGSSRDLGELRHRLQGWLTARLPDGADPRLTGVSAPDSNGMSSETVLFDLAWREDGTARTGSFVARIAPDPAAVPVFPVYDLPRQFEVMRLVAEHSTVPVPRVLWSEPDPSHLGEPFFVMERVEGVVPPDNLPYTFGSWLLDASPEERRRLQDRSTAVLADLHAIEHAEERFGFLQIDRPGATPLRRHVADQWGFYEWVAEGAPSPLIEACFAWLEDHWPADEGPTVLSWGDARIGNMMFRDFEPVAVLDWEMATLGPREIDLGWFIYLHRFFDDLATGFGMPGMPDFMRRDDVAAAYEARSGHRPRDLDFYTMYAALRHGIIMSRTQRRAIHFGEATMPSDVDDLIMHRSTLEHMLAGTYWDGTA